MESIINVFFAKHCEAFFMHVTLRRWKTKYQTKYNKADFEVAFKTKAYVSKNHPNNYQQKVMELYEEKLSTFGKLNSKTGIL